MDHALFDDVVRTDYGQFDIVWSDEGGFDGDFDRFFAGQLNGVVGAADPHGIYLNLGRRSGGSRLRIALLSQAPSVPGSQYDDVVEVSTTVPEGAEPRWMTWAAESGGMLPGLTPGTYRVRVSAWGRDAGHAQELTPEIVDEYLIELWPAAVAPDEILRSGSENAAYWHKEVGGRR